MGNLPTRRQLLATGGVTVSGLALYGVAAQEENEFESTLEWEGQGSEHATQDCSDGDGYWHWILTPGGPNAIETDAELVVEFSDGPPETVQGYRPGQGGGAIHFDVTRSGGGTVEDATAHFNGGGDNVNLTISDGECEDIDDEPPENGDDQPPENGDDEPPENGDDQPPENGDDEPPENGDDQPPENGDDEPPENGDDQPPENGDDEPPENGDDQPPENGDDEPPENGDDQPPENGGDEPPENGDDEPPENDDDGDLDDEKSKKEKRKKKMKEETKSDCD